MPIATQTNDIKERLSIAYLAVVAARAGCQIFEPHVDKQSVDATVKPIRGKKLAIDFQLKATSEDCVDVQHVIYDLPVNNYDALRDEYCTAPHYLVVLVLDPDESQWLEVTPEALVVRRCAYWLDLRGRAATINKTTVRVQLPVEQRFDVEALRGMMQDASSRIRPRVGGAA